MKKNILNADRAFKTSLIDDYTNKQKDWNTNQWHASSSGQCLRKTLIVRLLDKLPPEYLEAYEKIDPDFIGVMQIGHEKHVSLTATWYECGLVAVGPEDAAIETLFKLNDEQGTIIEVPGKGDVILSEPGGPLTWVDIKTFDTNQVPILEREMTVVNGVRFVKPKYKHALQITCYVRGLQSMWKGVRFTNPYICYICKGNNAIYWAEVNCDDWDQTLESYWLDVADAFANFQNTGKLPPPKPVEKWECRWGKRGEKKCKFFDLCFLEITIGLPIQSLVRKGDIDADRNNSE